MLLPHSIEENARAVLLPAFDTLTLSDEVLRFLDEGGVSILLGESRAEYLSRRMSAERRATESTSDFVRVTEEARKRSGCLLAAVDQEMGGICRLHQLVPEFPDIGTLERQNKDEIEALCKTIAQRAKDAGVNLFLAPVVDVLTGSNPWLEGRTLSHDLGLSAILAAAYVRGVQSGGVAACSKHFPGFASTTGDPAVDTNAVCDAPLGAVEAGLGTFRAVINAGTAMMMVGPAPVSAIDPEKAALRSPFIVHRLTEELGFRGAVMADDLDSAAVMRGDTVQKVAIDALNAGCHYLLLADSGTQIGDVADAIASAVKSGALAEEKLYDSAERVRAAAEQWGASN